MWLLFPPSERPREPGLRHICYVLAITAATKATPATAMVAYTSSQPLPPGTPVPLGVRVFGPKAAAALNQVPFRLHLGRLAIVPLTSKWIPELDTPGQGIVARAAPGLRDEIHEDLLELNRRRKDLITVAGPRP